MATSPTIEARYGMNRSNYLLDPATDWECFARSDVNVGEQVESLQIDLVTGLAPKRLFWGPYGSGKTHTLYTTTHQLDRLTESHAVHVECPDLGRRSSFHDLYRDGIMRNLGEDFTMGLLEGALEQVGVGRREEMITKLRGIIGDEELAKLVIQLLSGTNEILIWTWLSGVALGKADLGQLQLTQNLTDAQPARLAEILLLLGRLANAVESKKLVLVLDEMERSVLVGPEGAQSFVTAFTRLADPGQNDLALLIGCSAANIGEMPELFAAAGPVMTRFQPSARVEIPAMSDVIASDFIIKIIDYVREPTADVQQMIASAQPDTAETITDRTFPFSEQALDGIKSRLRQTMTPREIMLHMTQSVGRAHLDAKSVVTSDVVA